MEILAPELVGDESEMVVLLFFNTFFIVVGWSPESCNIPWFFQGQCLFLLHPWRYKFWQRKFIFWSTFPNIFKLFGELKPPCQTTLYFWWKGVLIFWQKYPCQTIWTTLSDNWNHLVTGHKEAAEGSCFISPTMCFQFSDRTLPFWHLEPLRRVPL